MKESPERAIELFIKFVKVYNNKIEIGLNYAVNQAENDETIVKKVFTKNYTTERHYKGGTIKTKTIAYDVYLVL